jgi:hypothetical protein
LVVYKEKAFRKFEELIEKSQKEINDFRKQKENPLFNS